ncbi:FMRFamide receptor-like isoform X1 [Clytia hemisphaerica]|uniref:G-protein coupled receptors family 1 profile domain-containing protein n=2 Tax=Clytia hemisphaerica TaxID=252671 RepID=A0A7M5X8S0_9CNID
MPRLRQLTNYMGAAGLHWICSVPIGITISLIGLIGNVISVIIWFHLNQSKSRRNKSTAQYFISLAFCDSALLLFFLLHDSLPSLVSTIKSNYYYAATWCWFLFPMFFFALVCSIWVVVGVTINRYIMIAFPTKVQIIYSDTRSKIGIFGITLFAFLVNLPHFFTYHAVKDGENGDYKITHTEYGASEASTNYEFWAHCIALVLGPWVVIAILNGLIIKILKNQMKKFTKEKPTKQMRQEQQMTRTLLFITFSFLILLAWQCVTQCFWMLGYGKGHANQNIWTTVDKSFAFAKLGVIINSSINWIFYCFTCSLFRKETRKFLGLRKSGNNHDRSSNFSSSITKSSSLGKPESCMIIANTGV